MPGRKPGTVFQFKIVLEGTKPPVWRRIQLPAGCTFWDLHVAIQDSMGWQDYHLHQFTVRHPVKGVGRIGIPSSDGEDFGEPPLPGWKETVSGWLTPEHCSMDYEYDFGDGWQHKVIFEGPIERQKGVRYPRCDEGARACPPEDCGGIPGYQEICDGKSEFQDSYKDYNPDRFDPGKIRFSNPARRLWMALSG
jgi:hypothetical protein